MVNSNEFLNHPLGIWLVVSFIQLPRNKNQLGKFLRIFYYIVLSTIIADFLLVGLATIPVLPYFNLNRTEKNLLRHLSVN